MARTRRLPLPKAGIDARGTKWSIKYDRDWQEWQVRAYTRSRKTGAWKFREGPTAYCSDRDDAIDTFHHLVGYGPGYERANPYIIKNINGKPHIVEYARKAYKSPPLLSKAFEEQFDSQHGPGAYKEHMRQLLKKNPRFKGRKTLSKDAYKAGFFAALANIADCKMYEDADVGPGVGRYYARQCSIFLKKAKAAVNKIPDVDLRKIPAFHKGVRDATKKQNTIMPCRIAWR